VEPVTPSQVPALTAMLVGAFDDDPVARFMFAGPRRRAAGLRTFFGTQLSHHYLPLGEVRTVADGAGVAIWGPPGRPHRPVWDLLEVLPSAPFVVSGHMHRAMQLLFEVEKRHPKEPHWYLATLASAVDRRGQGIGSALLAETLRRVDEEGTPAYLESSKPENVPLYARFGFVVMDELRGPGGAPPIWRMWREPRVPDLEG
jgi:GNAT superfamily N-acetyltransferase